MYTVLFDNPEQTNSWKAGPEALFPRVFFYGISPGIYTEEITYLY